MAMLEPQLAILDETDSGLDIDALRIVANGVNALRAPDRAIVMITHYQRLLDYVEPDHVHVLSDGRIVMSRRQEPRYGIGETRLRHARRRCGLSAVMCRNQKQRLIARLSAPAGTLAEKRREAFARFEELGFPTRRDEAMAFHQSAAAAR